MSVTTVTYRMDCCCYFLWRMCKAIICHGQKVRNQQTVLSTKTKASLWLEGVQNLFWHLCIMKCLFYPTVNCIWVEVIVSFLLIRKDQIRLEGFNLLTKDPELILTAWYVRWLSSGSAFRWILGIVHIVTHAKGYETLSQPISVDSVFLSFKNANRDRILMFCSRNSDVFTFYIFAFVRLCAHIFYKPQCYLFLVSSVAVEIVAFYE